MLNDELRFGNLKLNNSTIDVDSITKEFRIKKSRICIELIIYLRIYLQQHYKGTDVSQILSTVPVSFAYEEFVLQFALDLLVYLRAQFTTTNEHDMKLLGDMNIPMKKRFAIILRYSHKDIL